MVLYALGSNKMGQLGIGHYEDVSIPTRCSGSDEHCHSHPVTAISGGANHTIVLHESGVARTSGRILGKEKATRPTDEQSIDFQNVRLPAPSREFALPELMNWKVKFCAATWEASIYAVDLGPRDCVIVFGDGPKGELGIGEHVTKTPAEDPPYLTTSFPPGSETIVDMSSCLQHTAVVLSNGEVWGWGYGRKGQLGESVSNVAWTPTKVQGIGFRVERVACGREFTAVVGKDGQLTILGGGKWNVKAHAPEKGIPRFVDIQASWNGVYVLLEDGSILGWGRNDKGQLPPKNLPLVHKFAAGSEHVLALTRGGRVLAWGWGEHGNCGEKVDGHGNVELGTWNVLWGGKDEDENGKATGVGAGCATSFIEVDDEMLRR
jgi:protein ATS1